MPAQQLDQCLWGKSNLSKGLACLLKRKALPAFGGDNFAYWLEAVALESDLEVVALGATYGEVEVCLRIAGCSIWQVGDRYLLVNQIIDNTTVEVMGVNTDLFQFRLIEVAALVRSPHTNQQSAKIDQVVSLANLPSAQAEKVRQSILMQQLGANPIPAWGLTLASGAPLSRQIRSFGIPSAFLSLILLLIGQFGLWIATWYLISQTMDGYFESGIGWLWVLSLGMLIPLALASAWVRGEIAIKVGLMLKRRLMAGSLHLQRSEIRRLGFGRLMSCVFESETLETGVINGLLLLVPGLIELSTLTLIFSLSVSPSMLVLVVIWATIAAWLFRQSWLSKAKRISERMEISQGLIEVILGQRTRLVQQTPDQWHLAEDIALSQYAEIAKNSDGQFSNLTMLSRLWLLLGWVVLVSPILGSDTVTPLTVSVLVGSVILGQGAVSQIVGGAEFLIDVWVAWHQTKPFYLAASRQVSNIGSLLITPKSLSIQMQDVSFGYDNRQQVLRDVSLVINAGDRILVSGKSGSGKSTLLSILGGVQRPTTGAVFAGGLDIAAYGRLGWSKQVLAVPPNQDDHLFSGPLAFNLLLGRSWPPTPTDLQQAESVCRELGLGPLLDRMPGGLYQAVGEVGWRLSQGERSRIAIARAVLQNAQVIALDESLGSLDPETAELTLGALMRHAPALVIVMH